MVTRKMDVGAELERRLRQDIFSNKLCGGDRLNSELHFMRRYQLTRYQVRKAIGKLEHEGLLQSVQGSGTYVVPVEERPLNANPQAQHISSRQILFLYFANTMSEELLNRAEVYDPIFNGLSKVLHKKGYNLLFAKAGENMPPPPCMQNGDIGGIVFFGSPNPAFYEKYMSSMKCVGINSYDPGLNCAFVDEDNFSRSFQALEYLYKLGHRRIGFFSDCSLLHLGPSRYLGYMHGMEHFGLSVRPEWIVNFQQDDYNHCTSPWPEVPDYREKLIPMLESELSPTAIVCIDDPRSLAVKTALEKLGRTIPDDISIVGGYSYRQAFGNFTSLRGKLDEVCSEAALLLILALERSVRINGRSVLIRPQLTVGDSTIPYKETTE